MENFFLFKFCLPLYLYRNLRKISMWSVHINICRAVAPFQHQFYQPLNHRFRKTPPHHMNFISIILLINMPVMLWMMQPKHDWLLTFKPSLRPMIHWASEFDMDFFKSFLHSNERNFWSLFISIIWDFISVSFLFERKKMFVV